MPSADTVIQAQLTAAAAGAVIGLINPTYYPLRAAVTVLHEAGHALVAFLAGRRLAGVRIHRDTSGETISVGKSRGIGVTATLLAGYPAPSLVGLSGLACLKADLIDGWSLVMLVVLLGTMLLLRNLYGFVVMGAMFAAIFAGLHYLGAQQVAVAIAGVCAFLCVAGFRGALELLPIGGVHNDAAALAKAGSLPAVVWKTVFLVLTVACLFAAVWLMVPTTWRAGLNLPG